MNQPPPNLVVYELMVVLNRLVLGLYFFGAGLQKLFWVGLVTFVGDTYQKNLPVWLPKWIAYPYGYTLPFLELTIGAMLVVGFYSRVATSLMILLLLSFIVAMGFGFFSDTGPFSTNVILLTLALWLTVTGRSWLSLDTFLANRRTKNGANAADAT